MWLVVASPRRTGAPCACELLDLSARVGLPRAVRLPRGWTLVQVELSLSYGTIQSVSLMFLFYIYISLGVN